MRPRPNEGHIALQYIEELGELIEAGPPEESSNPRYTRIVRASLTNVRAILHACHCSELPDLEGSPIVPAAPLAKQDRSRRIDNHRYRYSGEHQD
jgi:hypothetical protein